MGDVCWKAAVMDRALPYRGGLLPYGCGPRGVLTSSSQASLDSRTAQMSMKGARTTVLRCMMGKIVLRCWLGANVLLHKPG